MAVAFSPDGKQLASAGADGQALLWDVETGEILLALQVHPVGIGVTRVAFSPDGTRLAAASDSDERDDGGALVSAWDLASGEVLYTVTGLPNRALALAFSPDGTKLPKLWDLATGQELATFPGHTSTVNGLAFSPDGSRLASSSIDGTTRVYAVDVEELIALAQSRLTRWWTPEECQQYLHTEECPPEP
jgi:WD40 repeat protein